MDPTQNLRAELSIMESKDNKSQEPFISKTPISFESEFKRRKAPDGDPPPGKVWSVEHGHWHDINPPNGSVDGH